MPTDTSSGLVLIVDDERDLRTLLDFNLRRAGWRTAQAASAREGLMRAGSQRPDLILLDLNLPDFSGTDVCRQLKADPATQSIPVVMLTARTDEADRIAGFELGADDYVPKPFSVRELMLRVEAVMRRRAGAEPRKPLLRSGPIEIDTEAFLARVDGREVELALLEYRLLCFLVEGAGRVCTREELLRRVWQYPRDSQSRTLETHIKRLRAKLGDAGDLIETVRSVGYRIRAE